MTPDSALSLRFCILITARFPNQVPRTGQKNLSTHEWFREVLSVSWLRPSVQLPGCLREFVSQKGQLHWKAHLSVDDGLWKLQPHPWSYTTHRQLSQWEASSPRQLSLPHSQGWGLWYLVLSGSGPCLFHFFLPGVSLSFIYFLSLVSPTPRGERTSVGTRGCHSHFLPLVPRKALRAKQEMQKARSCLTTLKSRLLAPPQETLLDCLKASKQKFLVNKLLQPIQINTIFCNVLPLQTLLSFKEGGRTERGREERRKR